MDKKMVHCQFHNATKEGLSRAPIPGELGEKILGNISKDAWQLWLIEQTKLINEYRLDPTNPQHIEQLKDACKGFLFPKEQL